MVAACEAIASLICEPAARTHMKELNGLSVMWQALTKPPDNVQLLTSAATLVTLCVSADHLFTEELIRLDALNW